MSISSISGAANYTPTSSSSSNNVSSLEKQAATIEQEIQGENSSKDDSKVKQAKVQALQAQLEIVNAEIQQASSKSSGAEAISQTSNVTKIISSESNSQNKAATITSSNSASNNNLIDKYI